MVRIGQGVLILATALASAVGISAVAQAEEAVSCAPFTLISDSWQRGFSGTDAPQVGDVRAGTRRLVDEAGNELGLYAYSAVVVAVGEGGDDTLLVTRTFSFADGSLAGASTTFHPEIEDLDASPAPIVTVVTGGSGVFREAHGTVEMGPFREDGSRVLTFDVACD